MTRFLEDVIKRLSAELARRMAADAAAGGAGSPSAGRAPWEAAAIAGAAAAGGGGGGGAGGGAPLPPWMRDPGFLNPLLAAYDQRVRELEEAAAARAEAARAIEGQVRVRNGMGLVAGVGVWGCPHAAVCSCV